MLIDPKFEVEVWEIEGEKSQLPGSRSAISGHRYYNPTIGRFLGRDPIEEKGGLHLYVIAGNNGINRWDYLGMDGSGSSWTDKYLLSLGIDPNGGKTAATIQAIQQAQAHFTGTYGKYNSSGGGGANSISGVSEIAGAGDLFQVADNGFNPIADNVSIGTVYQTNGKGQSGYGTSNGSNFSANIGYTDATTPYYGNIGTIQNLGTVGGSNPTPTQGAGPPDLVLQAKLAQLQVKADQNYERTVANYTTLENADKDNALSGLDGIAAFGDFIGGASTLFLGGIGAATEGVLGSGGEEVASEGEQAFDIGFQTEHAAPHFEGTGLSQTEIENQISTELNSQLGNGTPTTVQGPFMGQTNFQGTTIQYRGFGLPAGNINIGTYYPVGP